MAALVQSNIGHTVASSPLSVAFSSAVTSGNAIVVAVATYPHTAPTNAVTDSLGNTYTKAVEINSGSNYVSLFYALNVTGGSNTVTFTASFSSDYLTMVVHEFSGIAASSALDVTGTATGTGTTASVSATTTNAADVVIAAMSDTGSSGTPSAGTGWTLTKVDGGAAAYNALIAEYQIVSSTGAETATFNLTSQGWLAVLAAFKQASTNTHATATATDSASFSDSVAHSLVGARSASDTTSVSSIADRVTTHARSASDSTSTSDSAARATGHTRSIADTVAFSDSAAQTTVTANVHLSKTASDTVAFSDSATQSTTSVNVHLVKTATDTLSTSDAPSRHIAASRNASDAVSTTDAAVRSTALHNRSVSASDTFLNTDNADGVFVGQGASGGVGTVATLGNNNKSVPNLFTPNTASPNAFVAASVKTLLTAAVTLQSSLLTLTYGQSTTLTATVSGAGATPTGSVTFYDGTTVLGTSALSGGAGAITTTYVSAGSRSLTVVYSGDPVYASAQSSALSVTVNQAQTATTLTSSTNPVEVGKLVTLTATISVTAPGTAANLSGVITFSDGATTLGVVSLRNGVAALAVSSLAVGSHTITASFAGTVNYIGSSGSVTETVNAATPKFSITSTVVGSSADYAPYLYTQPVKMDRINEPDYLDMSLIPWDNNFVKLSRGAYVQLYTQTYGVWYTGYVTNDPELEQLGSQGTKPIFGFKYELSSDDYLLNLKPLGLLSPFLNMTQGQILKRLVGILAPLHNYDLSNIADGLTLSRYVVDPTQHFTDVVTDFCTTANYRWAARSGKLYFVQSDVTPAGLVIDGNDQHFTPTNLKVIPSKDPIINDAIVLGDIEPQNLMIEYHIGDGWTDRYPLISSVFGADSSVLLDDDFSNSQIDNTKWDVFDVPQNFIQVFNGYLNALGGTNTGAMDVFIQSANLIPLEGNLRITHGVFEFIQASDGVIAGLWKDSPDSSGGIATSLNNCIYGIRATKNSDGSTTLQPIINGAVDMTQSLPIRDYSLIYIMRTICQFNDPARWISDYSYMTQDGVVNTVGGIATSGTVYYQTYIVAYDPATNVQKWSRYFTNQNVQIPNGTVYGYYMPLVLNDLHCTVSGLTISTPMQVTLDWVPQGGTTWTRKLVGANDMDSYDGLQPTATITDANQGWTTKSSKLGRSQYNPGSAVLEYISNPSSDPTAQSVAPNFGDQLKITYRRAGAAVARVQDKASVVAEAASWGDDGLRSITRQDLQPSPRNTQECEIAAQAIVGDYGRQHWDGSYQGPSTYSFTGEMLSGTILKFQNLTLLGYSDSLTSEVIQEVQTTLVSMTPNEVFDIQIKFGRKDSLKSILPKLTKKVDVFMPQDSAEIPIAIDTNSVGTVFAPEVTQPTYQTLDSSYIYFNTNQTAPVGGGFEIRYSDDSWGADPGRNLVTRIPGTTFQIPRTTRGKVVFIKAYDGRNKCLFSEDLTAPIWARTNAAVTNDSGFNPNNNLATLSTVAFSAGDGVLSQNVNVVPVAGTPVVFSASVKGTAGQTVHFTINSLNGSGVNFVVATVPVTFTGEWQRVSVSVTLDATANSYLFVQFAAAGSAVTFQATMCSFEVGTLTETAYFKTTGIPYGAQSRWATGIHCAFPLAPLAPVATLTYPDPAAPIITIPIVGGDAWGYEVRGADNATVLARSNFDRLTSGLNATYVDHGNTSRDLTYFVYYYNMLSEYGPAQTLNATLFGPTVQNVHVDDQQKKVLWEGVNGDSFMIELMEQATSTANLLYFSEAMDNPVWTGYNRGGTNPTIVANAATAPDGTNNATQINLPATDYAALSAWAQVVPIDSVSGKTYTFSVWLRSDNPLQCYVSIEGEDFVTEIWTLANVTSAWQRFSATVTFPTTTTTGIRVMINGGGEGTPAETVYAWGAQLEQASSAGTYVASTLGHIIAVHTVSVQEYTLADSDFFAYRTIRVTPYDNLGFGVPVIINHFYKPAPVKSFATTVEVTVVTSPPTPHTDPVPPPTVAPHYQTDYISIGWLNYQTNRNRRLQE